MLLSQVWHGMVGLVGGAVTPVPSPNEAKQGLGRPRPCKEALQPFLTSSGFWSRKIIVIVWVWFEQPLPRILPVSPIYAARKGRTKKSNQISLRHNSVPEILFCHIYFPLPPNLLCPSGVASCHPRDQEAWWPKQLPPSSPRIPHSCHFGLKPHMPTTPHRKTMQDNITTKLLMKVVLKIPVKGC